MLKHQDLPLILVLPLMSQVAVYQFTLHRLPSTQVDVPPIYSTQVDVPQYALRRLMNQQIPSTQVDLPPLCKVDVPPISLPMLMFHQFQYWLVSILNSLIELPAKSAGRLQLLAKLFVDRDWDCRLDVGVQVIVQTIRIDGGESFKLEWSTKCQEL